MTSESSVKTRNNILPVSLLLWRRRVTALSNDFNSRLFCPQASPQSVISNKSASSLRLQSASANPFRRATDFRDWSWVDLCLFFSYLRVKVPAAFMTGYGTVVMVREKMKIIVWVNIFYIQCVAWASSSVSTVQASGLVAMSVRKDNDSDFCGTGKSGATLSLSWFRDGGRCMHSPASDIRIESTVLLPCP